MKRVWKLFDAAQAEFHRNSAKPTLLTHFPLSLKTSTVYRCTRQITTHDHSPRPFLIRDAIASASYTTRQVNHSFETSPIRDIIGLFSCTPDYYHLLARQNMSRKVSIVRDELVRVAQDSDRVLEILEDNSGSLFWKYPDGFAFAELLDQLEHWPDLVLMVLNWRRKNSLRGTPMALPEYSKCIKVAGRFRNIDLAVELFNEAANKLLTRTATYNALMSAYMYNGLTDKCFLLYRRIKMDATSSPNIVTYNILISCYSRLMLVKQMEVIFAEISKLNLSPNINTYNYMISGYVTAWNWNKMEQTFQMLKSSPVRPDTNTYLLMLRGYALSGNLEKMEETYLLVRDHVNEKKSSLIRCMICAYCGSSSPDRVKKIEELLKLIPERSYRPWLTTLLIKFYAKEDMLEEMENAINEAFEHKVTVKSLAILRSILATYFRKNLLDRLENFVRNAEDFDWKLCRSMYHCKMIMYGSQNFLKEMESVPNEMENVNIRSTKKTLLIMYKAYVSCGQRSKVEKILGLMCKHGYEFPDGSGLLFIKTLVISVIEIGQDCCSSFFIIGWYDLLTLVIADGAVRAQSLAGQSTRNAECLSLAES
ncbi:pentatricopeptide repeat-containing protein [Senna tora]|uniref:Pentatricopeptide repeat-containing protein n=1 Tax=Senna tora TaxID=362788 RepID=A0A834WER9_9FABA|nr:pentatricopeptide repeat-containing protein [Senna tora]